MIFGCNDPTGNTLPVGYSYLANSPLVESDFFTNDVAQRMVTTKSYDYLNRLLSISSSPSSSFKYSYNSANQRTSVTNLDGCYWIYTYDSLGQVTSGKKYWPDHSPVAGQQFEYSFDDIGNRTSTRSRGNGSGGGLQPAAYSANSLNQYDSREVPGYVNITGTAKTNATVSLWTADGFWAQTERHSNYFHGELPANNSIGALWLTITNVAVLRNGTNADIITNVVGNEEIKKNLTTPGQH